RRLSQSQRYIAIGAKKRARILEISRLICVDRVELFSWGCSSRREPFVPEKEDDGDHEREEEEDDAEDEERAEDGGFVEDDGRVVVRRQFEDDVFQDAGAAGDVAQNGGGDAE